MHFNFEFGWHDNLALTRCTCTSFLTHETISSIIINMHCSDPAASILYFLQNFKIMFRTYQVTDSSLGCSLIAKIGVLCFSYLLNSQCYILMCSIIIKYLCKKNISCFFYIKLAAHKKMLKQQVIVSGLNLLYHEPFFNFFAVSSIVLDQIIFLDV